MFVESRPVGDRSIVNQETSDHIFFSEIGFAEFTLLNPNEYFFGPGFISARLG